MSLWSNCSWRLMVWVEITTRRRGAPSARGPGRIEDRRHEVGETLPHARPRLDNQVPPLVGSPGPPLRPSPIAPGGARIAPIARRRVLAGPGFRREKAYYTLHGLKWRKP